jgi:hypothetical protein
MRTLIAIPLFFLVAAMLLLLAVFGLFLDRFSPGDDWRKWPGTGRVV